MEVIKKLFIVDSTVISLFKDILKVAGRPRKDGKSKGGIKAHVIIHAAELMPCLLRFTEGSRHDHTFLKHLNLPEGSYLVMDKGYTDYYQYAQWTERGIFFITRMKNNAKFESLQEVDLPQDKDQEILKDETITVHYTLELEASTIAAIYKYRWQIELLFKKLKQNFPLKYFLGDNQNAIEIQIWCALISLLLMEVIRKQLKRNWAFSNMVAITRFHLTSYVHLTNFLNNPDKELQEKLLE
jgi:transposase